jgi:hypothetical protein
MGKYDPLREYLAGRSGHEFRMTFGDIERLVGDLPSSARDYRAWWANDSKVEAQAWRAAGWHVQSVNLAGETVIFVRTSGHGAAVGSRPSAHKRLEMTEPSPPPGVERGLPRARPPQQSAPQEGGGEAQISRRADIPAPGATHTAQAAVLLIGCVHTKRPAAAAAAELFTSPLFDGRRRYAAASGLPWYILSAKFGLLAPDDVIGPYDVYLADQSPGYKKAWGEFVVAALEQHEHDLHGHSIEVHAGAAYVDPLRAPLTARGAKLVTPLAHLRQGEQLAWYGTHAAGSPASAPPASPPPDMPGADPGDLALRLSDPSRALSPQDLLDRGRGSLLVPGLYSWWVDEKGAADLSRGLGHPVTGGMIYAGQAGATRWPSGKRSANTLWGRITGMHLGGAAEFSTFRRTLAAILRPVLELSSEDDPQLSAWINAHLRVNAVPVPDADRLGQIETAVLGTLDPPLNLSSRPITPIRARLAELRRGHDVGPAAAPAPPVLPQSHSSPARKPSVDQAERRFHQDMVAIYETAKRELGYTATRFLQMISEHGGLATARQLLWSEQPSDGFTTLWLRHRLDLTVEAHVLHEEFTTLFTDADRQRARDRLESYGWQESS